MGLPENLRVKFDQETGLRSPQALGEKGSPETAKVCHAGRIGQDGPQEAGAPLPGSG